MRKLYFYLFFSFLITLPLQVDAQKRVLLEKYTSAWCGYCPGANLTIAELRESYPELVVVLHHSSVDGMGNPYSSEWKDQMNVFGTPRGMMDRTAPDSEPLAVLPENWEGRLIQQLEEPATVELGMEGTYNKGTRRLDLQVSGTFEDLTEAGELRLNVMIVEDSVVGSGPGWFQSNYYDDDEGHPLEGTGNPIHGYVHNHVLREVLDGTWGTSGVFPDLIELGNAYTKEYTYYLPAEFRSHHITIVAFVSYFDENNYLNRKVINVTEVPLMGENIVTDARQVELPDGVSVNVFPNPTSETFQVQLTGWEKPVELIIYDSFGRMLRRENPYQSGAAVDLKDWAKGMYHVVVRGEEWQFSEKVVLD